MKHRDQKHSFYQTNENEMAQFNESVTKLVVERLTEMLEVNPDDIGHLVDAIATDVCALHAAELAELNKVHNGALKALKKAHAAELTRLSDESDEEKPKKVRRKTTTKSGERKKNRYSGFVGLVARLNPGKRDNHADLAGLELTVVSNFSTPAGRCALRFTDKADDLKFNGEPILGQTLTLGDLYDVITAGAEFDDMFKNNMVRAGVMWGLMSDETHDKVAAYM